MPEHILDGEPPLAITLRRSARARRFSLRVSRLDGRVTLSMPARAHEAEALDFARSKAAWLRAMISEAGERETVGIGTRLPVEGRPLAVTAAPVRAVRAEGGALLVPGTADRAGRRVQAFLKLLARDRLWVASRVHAGRLGRPFSRLTLRDTRSRWGSCTQDGGLMYSWRLIMAPPEVLDYVAAHEVAHLAEMNHSPAFWGTVAELLPGYARHRQWLKRNGAALHRWDFVGR
ncbi:hypothetical protein DEA8626_03880 [Defluviimonas aquaemixtae]|uniref:YgjP-like metallopeptidase domain-containing protein n=1 Tax=Albidovulum aquaemixtae TaxID=1542388 RepID=A0A2R8BN40_9RHOB|nr:SprT family zinc-dependent metalloprotease [Defluviimonas aquaemixtae]SPH24847.1 hypothetical protein DEA8626_03880 [Defluviimonas aquaemixtae]